MFNVGPWELGIALVIALVIFGPGKLPQLGSAIGKTVKEFRSSVRGVDSLEKEVKE